MGYNGATFLRQAISMMLSMTAFSRQQLERDWGSLAWEIRSVNHRYLEVSLRLPEQLRSLENPVREKVRKLLDRGKVECQLRYQPVAAEQVGVRLNDELIARLLAAHGELDRQSGGKAQLNSMDLLRWPGVVMDQQADSDVLQAEALSLFDAALDELVANRQREGEALKGLISQRLDGIRHITRAVREKLPDILKAQHASLKERLAELKVELEPARLEQEIALLAQKADVAEELDRLESHVDECARVLDTRGQKGRRLDFLMQELNREANTLSSKSIVTETTLDAVELKVLIEQMREQIQNIE